MMGGNGGYKWSSIPEARCGFGGGLRVQALRSSGAPGEEDTLRERDIHRTPGADARAEEGSSSEKAERRALEPVFLLLPIRAPVSQHRPLRSSSEHRRLCLSEAQSSLPPSTKPTVLVPHTGLHTESRLLSSASPELSRAQSLHFF